MICSFRSFILAVILVLSASLFCSAQSPDAAPPAQSDTAKPAASTSSAATSPKPSAKATPAQDGSPAKKKPKKVWTNEEVSQINGNVSVVGGAQASSSSSGSSASSANPSKDAAGDSSREKQLGGYRDRLRKLRMQLEDTDKKLSELRNFKGDNSSASGGINMNQGYSMTPVAEQIKQLEAKRAQIQDQVDSVESEARKNGFDPGELR
jgi:hypothetical protein